MSRSRSAARDLHADRQQDLFSWAPSIGVVEGESPISQVPDLDPALHRNSPRIAGSESGTCAIVIGPTCENSTTPQSPRTPQSEIAGVWESAEVGGLAPQSGDPSLEARGLRGSTADFGDIAKHGATTEREFRAPHCGHDDAPRYCATDTDCSTQEGGQSDALAAAHASTGPRLRPYQHAAITAIESEFERGVRSTLLVLPTGCGKTVVFAELVRLFHARGQRSLVVAHREELLEQAQAKLRAVGVPSAIEKAERRARRDERVVVASVQTLQGKRRERFGADAFGLVVVDEAHHAPATSYRSLLGYFGRALVLGVTATPWRADGKGLGECFSSVAYRYELLQAIRDGWLAPIVARRIFVESIDLSGIKTRAGDLATDELAAVMATDEAILAVVLPVLEQTGTRRTIVFAVDVAHARALAVAICERRPGAARVAHGGLDDIERRRILADYRAGVFQFLVNVQLYTEGFDEPSVECVVCARPTKSWALYTQMVGRGTRLSPATGKRDLLLLDVAGNSGRHKLVGPVDALAAGEPLNDELRGEAERLLERGEHALDGLVDEAAAELERRRKAARSSASASYLAREVDPFFGDQLGEPYAAAWASEPATDDERQELADLGLKKLPPGITRGEAQQIIEADRKRRKAGLCSYKQWVLLGKFGIDARALNKSQASVRIGIIAQHDFGNTEKDRARIRSRIAQLHADEMLLADKMNKKGTL